MTTATTQVFRLPDLGEGLTEAELVQWLVNVGDEVRVDQAIAEVETAKSVVELPSPFAGTVVALHGEPGTALSVGEPVLEVAAGAPRPEGDSEPREATPQDVEIEAHRAEERAGSGNVLIGYGTTEHRATSRRRRPRRESSPAPRPRPAEGAPTTKQAVRSPLVRRLARDLGIDLSSIVPTGADGAVTRADVLRAANAVEPSVTALPAQGAPAQGAPAQGAPAEAPPVPGLQIASRERMSMLRRTASAAFSRSRSEIPEATVWVDVDATELWNLRPAMAAPGERPPSFTALLARFVLLALQDHPLLAGRLDGDDILTFDGVNLGVATDTPRGLMVPVLPHADRKPVAELDTALRATAEEARAGKLPPERLTGSTFTLNNYGAFGVDGSAAIINHPEVAILGVGRVIEKPWVVDGVMQPRRIAQLSLVFDHRVCDGGYAARFLRQVVDAIESPLSLYGPL
ncbi:dihydrolipoamide acetyltransferase family protein [Microbacterium sp. NPDC096154]|uniref:dihydrolipoamide acetyltransferase family protein n=1 Tax=Microbacterium sp. NPDC096154 TaxID=3155549 RepID=UPI00332199E4